MLRSYSTDSTTCPSPSLPSTPSTPPELANSWVPVLAHELRDPLNAIVLALDSLKHHCAEDLSARTVLDAAGRGSRQMARIIADVLELHRGSQDTKDVSRERISVALVISNAVFAIQPLLRDQRRQLSVQLPDGPFYAMVNASRLDQIVTNVLANAAKFTTPGGSIWLTVKPDDGTLLVRVRDDGLGMSKGSLSKVFNLGHRGPVTDAARPGNGIGLTLVSALVRMEGGTIEAGSDGLGQGSEFIVRLPAQCWLEDAERRPEAFLG